MILFQTVEQTTQWGDIIPFVASMMIPRVADWADEISEREITHNHKRLLAAVISIVIATLDAVASGEVALAGLTAQSFVNFGTQLGAYHGFWKDRPKRVPKEDDEIVVALDVPHRPENMQVLAEPRPFVESVRPVMPNEGWSKEPAPVEDTNQDDFFAALSYEDDEPEGDDEWSV